ncbi:MAG: PAC2 family protein [Candidatus Lokiarchaeota archaeon]|nr:PAC2 family protein [Candidatus Lokiarchaeota archaeon]
MNESVLSGIRLIKHKDFTQKDFNNPICILGMPGIADVGKFAIDTLIGQLNAINYVDIIFDDYPAGAIVDDSLLSAPKAEILVWKDPNNVRDIMLITADAQSLTPKGIYKISNFLSEIIFQSGIKLIIALGAYPVSSNRLKSKIPKIFITSTCKDLIEKFLSSNNCEKIQKGVIIGANGLIPTLAKARFNIDGLVMLAETDNLAIINEDITDLKASITLLDFLKRSFSLPINKKYSLENLDDISKNLQIKRDQLEKNLDTIRIIDTEDKKKSLYI